MHISATERLQAFSAWLRMGRLPVVQTPDGVELKFNLWHDPQNGRFTFAGTGSRGGWMGGGFTAGGGGSFGGAGATGTYPWPDKNPEPKSPRPAAARTSSRIASPPITPAPVGIVAAAQRQPELRRVVRNGYEYRVDAEGRTRSVSGTLTLSNSQLRSGKTQAQAGGTDRRPTDDGGHYIAPRFDGPTGAFNHFAQDRNFNRGGYRVLEDQWAKATKAGEQVSVRITPSYDGASKRPAAIDVWYAIDGHARIRRFPNERRETRHGKH